MNGLEIAIRLLSDLDLFTKQPGGAGVEENAELP
jgi:hypothetical protein